MKKLSMLAAIVLAAPLAARAQQPAPAQDESLLGEFVVTGSGQGEIPLPKIAVLPSLAPDMEDVTVRAVVRRDLELSGMFQVIADKQAPPGLYGFEDAVDVDAWKALGAESIVKVAARRVNGDPSKIEVFGLAYFLNVGKDPVYEKRLVVGPKDLRVTAHRVTDALLGALTGRNGGFASEFVFAAKDERTRRIFRMDADGYDVKTLTDRTHTTIFPAWGPNRTLFYVDSVNYSPFVLTQWTPTSGSNGTTKQVNLPFGNNSLFAAATNKAKTKLAVAVADGQGSAVWVGNIDGSEMKKVSNTPIATSPAFGPKDQLAWIGGEGVKNGGQRVYVAATEGGAQYAAGKVVSPPGFTAAAPTFCDTEDGTRIVYSVAIGNDRQDLIMSDDKGRGVQRLTQGQGTNQHPACSPDGRLIAFSSTRNKTQGIYFMTIKRWKAVKLDDLFGEQLRWEPLPPPPPSQSPAPAPAAAPAPAPAAAPAPASPSAAPANKPGAPASPPAPKR